MNFSLREILVYALAAVLIAAGTWWWYDNFEKRWEARAHSSKEARKNPMLAASRLLTQHGYTVRNELVLRDTLVKPLPPGMLIIAENAGLMSEKETNQLLHWVQAGNTLILRPKRWSTRSESTRTGRRGKAADEEQDDPFGERYGIVLKTKYECECEKKNGKDKPPPEKEFALISFPDAPYALQLERSWLRIRNEENRDVPPFQFGDESGEFVRVYREGQGQVVLVADNFFDNNSLRKFDQAELLLGFGQMRLNANSKANHVLIVQNLDIPKWYLTLWDNFYAGLIGIACLLLLLFWIALRRFGPILPDPDDERRSLIEHIDASGRWLWKVPGGREILLGAARNATNKLLQRRVPQLQRLEQQEQIRHLAETVRLVPADLVLALHRPASSIPAEFTRQIQTLQRLRKFHER